MKRAPIAHVMPMGDVWVVRAIDSIATYPTLEDALSAAERLAARRSHDQSQHGRRTGHAASASCAPSARTSGRA